MFSSISVEELHIHVSFKNTTTDLGIANRKIRPIRDELSDASMNNDERASERLDKPRANPINAHNLAASAGGLRAAPPELDTCIQPAIHRVN